MTDSFGREINYARLSIIDLCNLRCKYCMSEEGIVKKEHRQILSIEEFMQISDSLTELGINKIRLTGGEPLVRKGIFGLTEYLGTLSKIKTLALTTNGVRLRECAEKLKADGVNYVNISLDTLDPHKYAEITRIGDITKALEGLNEAIKVGFEQIKINAVLMKGINDDEISEFIHLSEERNIEVRFIELMPFSAQKEFAKLHYLDAGSVIKEHPELQYIGREDSSTAEYYTTANGGKIGFIRPMSKKFCAACNRIRVTADGMLVVCLHSNEMFNLRPHIGKDLSEFIASCILKKPPKHMLEFGDLQNREMDEIGG